MSFFESKRGFKDGSPAATQENQARSERVDPLD
jgi:hypothetical protein